MINNASGNDNTAVGYQAGNGVASNSYSSNSLFGTKAGFALSTGGKNTFIGMSVGSTTATGANNIALGYDIALPIADGSNQLNIGNLIFGTGINGEGTTLSTGNIGIATTSPWAKFSVAGVFGGTAPLFTISTSTASATSTAFIIDQNGNVGIGTTSPAAALTVNGNVTPNTSTVFTLGSATYLWSAVYATNGTIQTSDARLKDNVASTTYGLDQILQLRPVSYVWKAHPEQGTYLGFIAQEVQPILPETVTVGDDANHTLGLTYTEFIPVIVRAIQQLAAKISDLADTVAGFADHFATKELTFTRAEGDYVGAREINAHERFCIGLTCITESQFQALLASAGQSSSASPAPDASSYTPTTPNTPPTITIAGENPAHIHVGDKYGDLGATISAPEADKNLGIKTYLNGTLVSDIVLDTSTTGTDTIDYVVTDQNGLTSTSTRTVLIEPSAELPPPAAPIAASAATSSSQ